MPDKTPRPLSVYIHLPYCLRKCAYCDFNTYAVRSVPELRYSRALIDEARAAAENSLWRDRPLRSVFFGGGTPSLFSPESVGAMLDCLRDHWSLAGDAEITLEANPGTLEGSGQQRLEGYRAAGVNRLSFGMQSFDSQHLETLGRLHGAKEAAEAIRLARAAGFDNVSGDLIIGVPGQTVAQVAEDCRRMVELEPEHTSIYCLTYEDGTPLTGLRNAGRVQPAAEELELSMYQTVRDTLSTAGYEHYEISNFARPGFRARHNTAYWERADYLGLGAGAHGFAGQSPAARHSAAAGDDASHGLRYSNIRVPEAYMSAAPNNRRADTETLDAEQAMSEFVLLGLRLREGICLDTFESRFGCRFEEVFPETSILKDAGLLTVDGNWDGNRDQNRAQDTGGNDGDRTARRRLALTATGLPIGDTVITRLAGSFRPPR